MCCMIHTGCQEATQTHTGVCARPHRLYGCSESVWKHSEGILHHATGRVWEDCYGVSEDGAHSKDA